MKLEWNELEPGEWSAIIDGTSKWNALGWAVILHGTLGYTVTVCVANKTHTAEDTPRTLVAAQGIADVLVERALDNLRHFIDDWTGARKCNALCPRDILGQVNDVLLDAHDPDHEHTIADHADAVPAMFRREALGVERAIEILQPVIHDMVKA